jgi:hypothetical protein
VFQGERSGTGDGEGSLGNISPSGPTGQLYHLDDDPAETKNLWLEQPEIRDQLLTDLNQIRTAGRSRPE